MVSSLALIGFIADAIAITDKLSTFKSPSHTSIYVDAFAVTVANLANQDSLDLKLNKSLFEKLLPRHQILPADGPVFPETLDGQYLDSLYIVLIQEQALEGEGLDRLEAGYVQKKLIPSAHTTYFRNLFNEIPTEAIREALRQQKLEAADDKAEMVAMLDEVLRRLSSPHEYPGRHIVSEVINYREEQSKEVVVGARATIHHLTDGRFMERASEIAAAQRALKALLAEREQSTEPELSTLWITGKSGSGKSVILLQLLQKTVLPGELDCFWLDDASESLEAFLQAHVRGPRRRDFLIVFIDDFYSPQNRDSVNFQSIARLLRDPEYQGIEWPLLVTCGPPDHYSDFRRNPAVEGFRVSTWQPNLYDQNEKEALKTWFVKRTGINITTGPAFDQEEGLIVSLLVELQHDSLSAFGAKFRARLEEADLLEAMTLPLALNRLYIWTPKSWIEELSPEQRDEFDGLNTDKDFSFFYSEKLENEYLRLTHPHLSDAIYSAIRPNDARISRANDLSLAFSKALKTDLRLAIRILSVFADQSDRVLEGGDPEELKKKIIEAWKAWLPSTEDSIPMIDLLELWIQWARWAAIVPELNQDLSERPPLDIAIDLLAHIPDQAWGAYWLELSSISPSNPKLFDLGSTWLRNAQHKREVLWSRIWEAILAIALNHSREDNVGEIFNLGHNWLLLKLDRPDWNFVWQKLIEQSDHTAALGRLPALLALGYEWIIDRESKRDWTHVWEKLLDFPASVRPEPASDQRILAWGFEWLDGREDHASWTLVWEKLLDFPASVRPEDAGDQRLLAWGFEWLDGREDHASWTHVWQKLLDFPASVRPEAASDQRLLAWGFEWLDGREGHASWTLVWEKLLDFPASVRTEPASDQRILAWGFEWLDGREDHASWNFVWQKLLDFPASARPVAASDQHLLAWGFRWLEGREDHNSWSFVWEKLLDSSVKSRPVAASDQHLLAWGFRWLEGREDHDSWSFVWEKLLESSVESRPDAASDEFFLEWGFRWLEGREDHGGWSFALLKLVDSSVKSRPDAASDEFLLEWGFRWLEGREDHGGWGYLWEMLLDSHAGARPDAASDEFLLEWGFRWLQGRETSTDWPVLWRRLISIPEHLRPNSGLNGPIFKQGLDWLEGKERHRSWGFTYEKTLDIFLQHPEKTRKELLPTSMSINQYFDLPTRWFQSKPLYSEAVGIASKLLNLMAKLGTTANLDMAVVQWSFQWLPTNLEYPSWTYLWDPLWQNFQTTELLELGLSWAHFNLSSRKKGVESVLISLGSSKRIDHINSIYEWLREIPELALKQSLEQTYLIAWTSSVN